MGVPTSEVGYTCYAQEGGPRSPQRTCGGIGPKKKKKHIYIGVRLRFESSCIRINTVFCAMTQLRTLDGRYKMCVRNKGGDIFVEEGSSELY